MVKNKRKEEKKMAKKYLYDISLDDRHVADQGDGEFDSVEEARADADDFLISELTGMFNRPAKDFEVNIYESQHPTPAFD